MLDSSCVDSSGFGLNDVYYGLFIPGNKIIKLNTSYFT